MSGGTSALWRASLCGVVMALTVVGTGCAVETASDAEAEDTAEVTADLTLASPVAPGGLVAPKGPLGGPESTLVGTQTKSSTDNPDELMEPEPEPWKPGGRATTEDPNQVDMGATPGSSGDFK
jgi:hypothetical protein